MSLAPRSINGNALPWYQVLFRAVVSVAAGFYAAGAFADAIGNSLTVFTPLWSIVGTATIALVWLGVETAVRFGNIPWKFRNGELQRIKKLGPSVRLGILGAIGLLWVPRVYPYLSGSSARLLWLRVLIVSSVLILLLVCCWLTSSMQQRRLFLGGLLLLGVAMATSFWHLSRSGPAAKVRIVLAAFQGEGEKDYWLTHGIFNAINDLGRRYPDIEFAFIDSPIDYRMGVNAAREKGLAENADCLIWGSVIRTAAKVRIETHIELFGSLFKTAFAASSYRSIQDAGVDQFDSLVIQDDIAASIKKVPLTLLALRQIRYREFNGALKALNEILEDKPVQADIITAAPLYGLKGTLLNKLTRYEEAIIAFTAALTAKPVAIWYNNRGFAHRNLAMLDSAINDYTRAIAQEPTYALAYHNRCFAYKAVGKLDLAVDDCRAAVSLEPQDERFLIGLAAAYSLTGNINREIEVYTNLVHLFPRTATHVLRRASLRLKTGDGVRALSDYNYAVTLAPYDARVRHNRGWAYMQWKDFGKARFDFDAAIRLNPHYALAYANRCTLRHLMGEGDRALDDCVRARDIDPSLPVPDQVKAKRTALP